MASGAHCVVFPCPQLPSRNQGGWGHGQVIQADADDSLPGAFPLR